MATPRATAARHADDLDRMVHEHDSDDRADATGRHYPYSPSNPGERD